MLIRLADRKGILRNDVHSLQDRALAWLINQESLNDARLERERMKYTLLAGNPQLYDNLYNVDEDAPDEENIEWLAPESVEEVEDILKVLNSIQTQSETGI